MSHWGHVTCYWQHVPLYMLVLMVLNPYNTNSAEVSFPAHTVRPFEFLHLRLPLRHIMGASFTQTQNYTHVTSKLPWSLDNPPSWKTILNTQACMEFLELVLAFAFHRPQTQRSVHEALIIRHLGNHCKYACVHGIPRVCVCIQLFRQWLSYATMPKCSLGNTQ